MASNSELIKLFFHDLKTYNSSNFRTLEHADLTSQSPTVFKSCSSVVTRYFIFKERHPEFSDEDMLLYMLYSLRDDETKSAIESATICKELCKRFHYTQATLADILDMSRSQITNLIRPVSYTHLRAHET